MAESKLNRFNEVVSKLLTERLRIFHDRKLDTVTCVEVYQTIFNTVADIMNTAEAPLENEAVNYLAQAYYDAVLINGHEELDPNIFTTRATLKSIPTKELALMAVMLSGTDFAVPIIHEVKSRS